MNYSTIVNRDNIYILFFSFTLILISFGSIGDGWQGNFSVAKYITIFTLISFFLIGFVKVKIDHIKIIFILFCFSMLVSNLDSPYFFEIRQWYRFFNIFIVFVFGYSIYLYANKNNISLFNVFKRTMIFIGVLYVLVYLYAWFSIEDPRNYNWVTGLYIFNNIRNFSDFYSVIVLLAFSSLFFFEKYFFIKVLLFIVILSLFIWTGTRSAFLSVFISMVFLSIFLKINIKIILIFLLSLSLAIINSMFFYTNTNATGVINSINRTIGGNLSSSRVDLWLGIYELVKQKVFFGYGGEAVKFSKIGEKTINQNLTQAHNSILQVAIEWGLVGLILISTLIFILLKPIFLNFRVWSKNEIVCIAIILNILIVSLVNGAFYYTANFSMLAIFFALLYSEELIRMNNLSK